MSLAEVRLKKLSELIREHKAGRDALMREGQVLAARNISRKVAELERAYMILMREVQTQAELKRVTAEAKNVRDTYLMPTADMTLNQSDTERNVGAVQMQVGGAAPIGMQRAGTKKKRKKSKRRR